MSTKKTKIEVNASSIIEAARKPEMQRVTLYLDSALYKEFRDNCKREKLIVSDVASQLMDQFNKSIKAKKKRS